MKNRKRWMWIFAFLSAAVLCFIYFNSLLSREESGEQSGMVLRIILRLLGIQDGAEELHGLIRKLAHFCEFAALGLCVAGFTVNLGYLHGRKYIALPALITLAAAVLDEFIQYFSGRGSMVTDVVLDYSGALFGMGLTALYVCLRIRAKGKR